MKKLQFKGKEFKGINEFIQVKNNWPFLQYNVSVVDQNGEFKDHIPTDEAEAQARLFANSKKLLEAAIGVCKEFHNDVESAAAFKKLEQAILDSL